MVAGSLSGSGLESAYYDANLDLHGADLIFEKEKFYDPLYFLSLRCKIKQAQAFPVPLPSFARFCEQGLGKEMTRHDPGTAIFLVSFPDQVLGAQIMAGFIKSRYPKVQVVAMASIAPDSLDGACFDRLIWNTGPQGVASLMDFLRKIHGTAIDSGSQTILPDFKGMFLDRYPTPEKILLVYPFFFKDSVVLSRFLEDQVTSLGVQGFVFASDPLVPGGSTDMIRHLDHWFSLKQPAVFFGMALQIGAEPMEVEHNFSDLFSSGLRLIHWEIHGENARIPEKRLWETSKLGIWNHISGPRLFQGKADKAQMKFIVNNPNIVHSFGETALGQIKNEEAGFPVSEKFMAYARVAPLPGIAFWKLFGDLSCLLLYVNRLTKTALTCLRADPQAQSVITLGSQVVYFYQLPKDLPLGVLDEICKMVEAGGSVDITHVRSNLERAYLIGYAMENGVIIGNSSLKHPRQAFIQRLKQMTNVDFTYFVERGYTSVRPEYRAMGVGAKLLEGLTKRAGGRKVFSIISEDNLATQKIALRNKTKKILTYFSDKLNKEMGVWMPEHMIDPQGDEKK
ncbi:MAG: GNAT family N-acetyltransferase [Proteobacteria bacterium]|nr:GNAT family N-acetyltransferase [Pseudomonadota bacterium]